MCKEKLNLSSFQQKFKEWLRLLDQFFRFH
jgi:hypothetical protein